MYFTCDSETLGKYESSELKPGGADILVTESNKAEYMRFSDNFSCQISSHLLLTS